MAKVTVIFNDKTSVINADTLIVDAGYIYAYLGEDLRGVYKLSNVLAAYKTE